MVQPTDQYVFSGAALKAARVQAKTTQVELGRVMGVSHHVVSRWERGEVKPHSVTIAALRQALHSVCSCPPEEFLMQRRQDLFDQAHTALEVAEAVVGRALRVVPEAPPAPVEEEPPFPVKKPDLSVVTHQVKKPETNKAPHGNGAGRAALENHLVGEVVLLMRSFPDARKLYKERAKFSQDRAMQLSWGDYELYSAAHAVLHCAVNLSVAVRRFNNERGRWWARKKKRAV